MTETTHTSTDAPANRNLITAININWMLNGNHLSIEDVQKEFGWTAKEVYKEIAKCKPALEGRGIPWPEHYNAPVKLTIAPFDLDKTKEKKAYSKELDFDPIFILACNVILQLGDKRTPAAKLRDVGISVKQWENYLRVQKNWDFYDKLLREKFDKVEHEAMLSLSRNVAAGDLQSIKYYNEWANKYRPQSEVQFNLGVVLGRLMEALSRYLNPDQLNEIADVIEISLHEQKELTA